MLYFAYGSNLNHFQMKTRCKDSKYIKKFEIKNFRLTFMRIFQFYIKKYTLIMIVKKLWHTAWLKRVYLFTQAKGILM